MKKNNLKRIREIDSTLYGTTKDGQKISVKIRRSKLTGKFLCVLHSCQPGFNGIVITAWQNKDRANKGAAEIINLAAMHDLEYIKNNLFDFVVLLSDDDDEVICVV